MQEVGTALPRLVKGPFNSSRIARWCAAQENWDRIHYDIEYAQKVAKLPYTIINGALKQHLLCQSLTRAFGAGSWIWRLDFRFTGMDLVGQSLAVEGRIADVSRKSNTARVTVDLRIRNLASDETTTQGIAVMLVPEAGRAVTDALDLEREAWPDEPMPSPVSPDLPAQVRARIGTVIDDVESYSAVEAGRLRLFAEAVMDVPAIHYDADAAAAGPYGGLAAMPLYPIHAISRRPGELELSTDARAMGREGVCEIGRDLATVFGFSPTGLLNGGNRVQVHSLVRPGERVHGRSVLRDVRSRTGKRGGAMLIFETANEYRTSDGRPLLAESQSIVYRMGH